MKNNLFSRSAGFIAATIVLVGLVFLFSQQSPELEDISLSQLSSRAEDGEIELVEQQGNELIITVEGKEEPSLKSRKDPSSSLEEQGIDTSKFGDYDIQEESSSLLQVIGVAAPFISVLLIIGFFWYMMSKAQGQGNQAMSFGKSKAQFTEATKRK